MRPNNSDLHKSLADVCLGFVIFCNRYFIFLCKNIFICSMIIRDIKFAVCLSVCSGCISSKTAEWIWLKFCTRSEVCDVCPSNCISHFGGDCPGGPSTEAENVQWGRYCANFALTNLSAVFCFLRHLIKDIQRLFN